MEEHLGQVYTHTFYVSVPVITICHGLFRFVSRANEVLQVH
jgi:hypothetical protein